MSVGLRGEGILILVRVEAMLSTASKLTCRARGGGTGLHAPDQRRTLSVMSRFTAAPRRRTRRTCSPKRCPGCCLWERQRPLSSSRTGYLTTRGADSEAPVSREAARPAGANGQRGSMAGRDRRGLSHMTLVAMTRHSSCVAVTGRIFLVVLACELPSSRSRSWWPECSSHQGKTWLVPRTSRACACDRCRRRRERGPLGFKATDMVGRWDGRTVNRLARGTGGPLVGWWTSGRRVVGRAVESVSIRGRRVAQKSMPWPKMGCSGAARMHVRGVQPCEERPPFVPCNSVSLRNVRGGGTDLHPSPGCERRLGHVCTMYKRPPCSTP